MTEAFLRDLCKTLLILYVEDDVDLTAICETGDFEPEQVRDAMRELQVTSRPD